LPHSSVPPSSFKKRSSSRASLSRGLWIRRRSFLPMSAPVTNLNHVSFWAVSSLLGGVKNRQMTALHSSTFSNPSVGLHLNCRTKPFYCQFKLGFEIVTDPQTVTSKWTVTWEPQSLTSKELNANILRNEESYSVYWHQACIYRCEREFILVSTACWACLHSTYLKFSCCVQDYGWQIALSGCLVAGLAFAVYRFKHEWSILSDSQRLLVVFFVFAGGK
jgi:hypothetical protein